MFNVESSYSRFYVIYEGSFGEKDVKITFDFNSTYISEEIGHHNQIINKKWLDAKEKNKNKGFVLFSGKLCRLLKVAKYKNELRVVLGKTTYKEYIGTRDPLVNKDFKLLSKYLSNPLAICTVLLTKDSKLVFIKRNPMFVETMLGCYDVPGGFLNQPISNTPNPFDEIKRELKEELNIKSKHIMNMNCLGMIYDLEIYHPEIIMRTSLNITSEELYKNINKLVAKDQEAERIVLIEDKPSNVYNFIVKFHSLFSPTGLANIFIYGSSKYGVDWRQSVEKLWL